LELSVVVKMCSSVQFNLCCAMTGEDDGQENSSYVNGASPWLAYIGCI